MKTLLEKIDNSIRVLQNKEFISMDVSQKEYLKLSGGIEGLKKCKELIAADANKLDHLKRIVFEELYDVSQPGTFTGTVGDKAKYAAKELLQAIVVNSNLMTEFNAYVKERDNAKEEK